MVAVVKRAGEIGGRERKPGDVVDLAPDVIARLEAAGRVERVERQKLTNLDSTCVTNRGSG